MENMSEKIPEKNADDFSESKVVAQSENDHWTKFRRCIARTLLRHPALLICDEATSALDVSVQKEIVELLQEVQREEQMALLFISHDLALVSHVCSRIIVLSHGEIIEHFQS